MDEHATWYGVDLSPGHIVLDGDPSTPSERGTAAPLFSYHVYCGHGRPSRLLLSSCFSTSIQSTPTFPCVYCLFVHFRQSGKTAYVDETLRWSEAARNEVVRDDVRRKAATVMTIMMMLMAKMTLLKTTVTDCGHHLLPSQRGSYEHRAVVQHFRHCVVSQQYRRRQRDRMQCRHSDGT